MSIFPPAIEQIPFDAQHHHTVRVHCFIIGSTLVVNCHADDIEPGWTAEVAIRNEAKGSFAPEVTKEFRLSGTERVTAQINDIRLDEGSIITIKDENNKEICRFVWEKRFDDCYLEIAPSGSITVSRIPLEN